MSHDNGVYLSLASVNFVLRFLNHLFEHFSGERFVVALWIDNLCIVAGAVLITRLLREVKQILFAKLLKFVELTELFLRLGLIGFLEIILLFILVYTLLFLNIFLINLFFFNQMTQIKLFKRFPFRRKIWVDVLLKLTT